MLFPAGMMRRRENVRGRGAMSFRQARTLSAVADMFRAGRGNAAVN